MSEQKETRTKLPYDHTIVDFCVRCGCAREHIRYDVGPTPGTFVYKCLVCGTTFVASF